MKPEELENILGKLLWASDSIRDAATAMALARGHLITADPKAFELLGLVVRAVDDLEFTRMAVLGMREELKARDAISKAEGVAG